jgi:hypothetical protein
MTLFVALCGYLCTKANRNGTKLKENPFAKHWKSIRAIEKKQT